MALTDIAVRNARSAGKPRRISDGRGLFIEIRPNGSKYWRMHYRFGGKQKTLAFGVYPEVSLAQARERREEAKKMIATGVDPGEAKKKKGSFSGEDSFETVAREWHSRFSPGWSESHGKKLLRRLEKYIFPWIGSCRVGEISAPQLLSDVLRRIEARGHLEAAHRCLQVCGQVFRYAVQTGRAKRDPTTGCGPYSTGHRNPECKCRGCISRSHVYSGWPARQAEQLTLDSVLRGNTEDNRAGCA